MYRLTKKAAKIVELTTRSAVSNLLNTEEGAKVNPDELVIAEAYALSGNESEGISYKEKCLSGNSSN